MKSLVTQRKLHKLLNGPEMPNHAPRPPSSASRWINCPGSITMIANGSVPRGNSPEAEFGTLCHKLAERWISTGKQPEGMSPEVTEQIEHYVAFCQGFTDSHVESRVKFADDIWGTVDFWALNSEGDLVVCDLKTGMGYVEEFENWQLIIYALAIIRTHKINPNRVFLVVCQRGVRMWEPSMDVLTAAGYMLDRPLEDKVQAGHHCRYCPARHRCKALWISASQLAEAAYEPTSEAPTEQEYGWKLSEISSAIERLKAVESGIISLCASSNITPLGWEWKQALGNRQWKVSEDYLAELGDFMIERKAISPAKAEKLLTKEQIESLTFRPDNGRKLTKISAKKARKVFGK